MVLQMSDSGTKANRDEHGKGRQIHDATLIRSSRLNLSIGVPVERRTHRTDDNI